MRMKSVFYVLLAATWISHGAAQADDPTKKLGAFLGKWEAEGTMGGDKITSVLECRWSPQGLFLVCEQSIKTTAGDRRQLTIYSYNSQDSAYGYVTIAGPGAKPTTGKIQINGNVWIYPGSFENNGKTILIKTTNEFTDPRTEVYKTERSEDGGTSWKTILQGTAHKVGD